MNEECRDRNLCIEAGVNESECKGHDCEHFKKKNFDLTEYNRRAKQKQREREKAKNDNKLQA